jgi:hypothetical protein
MAGKVSDGAEGSGVKPVKPVHRLCNEIQLFDLCELEKCGNKQGLYCTSTELLNRFEAIAEEDERPAASGEICEEDDDALASDNDEYDDTYDDVQFGDEGYEEDPEDQEDE